MIPEAVARELSEARRGYAAAESALAIALARLNAAERAARDEFEVLVRGHKVVPLDRWFDFMDWRPL